MRCCSQPPRSARNEIVTFRRVLAQKLTTVADIVGRNCTAALAFGDRAVAKDVLAALQVEPGVEGGSVYDREGRLFATYVQGGQADLSLPSTPGQVGTRFEGRHLVVVRPIMLDGERVGTVYIRSTLAELTIRMLVFTAVMLTIMTGCALIALVISSGLQRWLSKPILDLARTARLITSDRNFALRATLVRHDEVGMLIEDFNRMLAEIEQQDRQLRQHQEQLEVEVAHRTAELVAANEQLVVSVRRVESHADQIAQLTALGQLLQSCQTAAEVFGVVQHAMRKLFPEDSGALTVQNSSGNLMEVMAMWGNTPPQQRVFGPEDCWAFRRGRAHLVSDADSPLRCAHLTRDDGPVTVCVPMMAQGDNLGVLQFNFGRGEEADAEDETGTLGSTRGRLAVALAEHIALALANLRLREALRNQSIVDPLTGLFNRRYLEQVLERECRRAIRSGRPLTVLILDVDHFKELNDRWGHDGGDAVLRELAGLMRSHFRSDDVACRYGGDEFVVLLADASLKAARLRAEELRLLVQRLSVQHRKQTVGSITISLGLAALADHGVTPDRLIQAADRALYEAKTTGRDRTICAPVGSGTAVSAMSGDASYT